MTFQEFVTPKRIIFLLARERAKCVHTNRNPKKVKGAHKDDLCSQLEKMLPPHKMWVRPDKRSRQAHDKRWCDTFSITQAIEEARKTYPSIPQDKEYLDNLDAFIARIRERACQEQPVLESPKTVAMFKKEDSSKKKVVYRPISIFTNLEDKILIALASRYLMGAFNKYLHEEILSYRPARIYHGSKRWVITSQMDAVANAKEYRARYDGSDIYVAECDIQKFYDIINHDVVLGCFDKMAAENHIEGYRTVRPLLKAYLDSYNFHDNVWVLNSQPQFWSSSRSRYRHGKFAHRPDISFRFDWVDKQAFTDPVHGCYSEEEYDRSLKQIGVPQGGALSPVISDVVMNVVDAPVIGTTDPKRFFNRYGDDILLMHTDCDECHRLIEEYRKSLRSHKFIYHPFLDFGSYKKGASTRRSYWDAKSKDAFLWGKGSGNASEWIGFVGYELSRDGGVRLRRSTMDKKFSAINKTYHKVLKVSVPQDQEGRAKYEKLISFRLGHISDSIGKCNLLTRNRHTTAQIASLDRYRQRKIHKLKDAIKARQGGFLTYDVFKKLAAKEYSFATRFREITEDSTTA